MAFRFPGWSSVQHIRWRRFTRIFLLCLILAAFARLVWRLGAQNLWWDESLSLQRAESPLGALLAGRIVLTDGIFSIPTTDQHPFAFFTLLGLLIRGAGTSEFVLRFPAAMASTLLVPMAWALGRLLARRGVLPSAAAPWAALLAAADPFYLWYGQEARMYTWVALLALASTYLLLRWIEKPRRRGLWLAGYLAALTLLLCTHYLSLLILPVHGMIFFQALRRTGSRAAWLVAGAFSVVGAVGLGAVWLVIGRHGAGTNFVPVSLRMIVPDLVNAFSLGLSVDFAQVKWLDVLFGGLALAGAGWSIRPGSRGRAGAWWLPLCVALPVLALQIIQVVQPAYMNARHMSLISGVFLLLVAGGLGGLWTRWRPAGAMLGAVVLAGMVYSTANYFTQPQYGKDNFRAVGDYLQAQVQPGDLVLVSPPEMLRLYQYYLPLDALRQDNTGTPPTTWQAIPLLTGLGPTDELMARLTPTYRRIWLVSSGMVPLNEDTAPAQEWPGQHLFLVRDVPFPSNNSYLRVKLFLPHGPAVYQLPANIQHPIDATFDGKIRLAGYDTGRPLLPGSARPVTLYWQPLVPMSQHYKYILRVAGPDGSTYPPTEREPYDGTVATTFWAPGQTIVEYSQVMTPGLETLDPAAGPYHLLLQVYDAETLQKLPLTAAPGMETADHGETLVLPYAP
jgi:mannosyltransferase